MKPAFGRRITHMADRFRQVVGVDMGTAYTRICRRNEAQEEPTLIALHKPTNRVLGWGDVAMEMQGRETQDVELLRPVQGGVMAHFDASAYLLRSMVRRSRRNQSESWLRPKLLLAVPPDLTPIEEQACLSVCLEAGAAGVRLIASTTAAAIGAGLDIGEPPGQMVIELGAARVSAAVFSRSGVVVCRSYRMGGEQVDASIADYFRRTYQIWIGQQTARLLKEEQATLGDRFDDREVEVRGMDLFTGLPKRVTVQRSELREVLCPFVHDLCQLIQQVLERTPPELLGDLMERGLVLTGGLARLNGLPDTLANFTGCPVTVPELPHLATTRGICAVLGDMESFWRLLRGGAPVPAESEEVLKR